MSSALDQWLTPYLPVGHSATPATSATSLGNRQSSAEIDVPGRMRHTATPYPVSTVGSDQVTARRSARATAEVAETRKILVPVAKVATVARGEASETQNWATPQPPDPEPAEWPSSAWHRLHAAKLKYGARRGAISSGK